MATPVEEAPHRRGRHGRASQGLLSTRAVGLRIDDAQVHSLGTLEHREVVVMRALAGDASAQGHKPVAVRNDSPAGLLDAWLVGWVWSRAAQTE